MRLDRRRLLAGAGAALGLPLLLPALAQAKPARRLIFVMNDGGWDTSFALDPKLHTDQTVGPEVDEDPQIATDREAVRTFGNLPVQINDHKRPAVTTFFEQHGHRCAIVNGIWMGAIAHATARVRILTGTHTQANAAWATIAGHELGQDRPLGSIDLSASSLAGDLASSMGQIGQRAQLQSLLSPESSFVAPAGADYELPLFRPDDEDQQRLFDHVTARNAAFAAQMNGDRNAHLIAARAEAVERARRLRAEGAAPLAELRLGAKPSLQRQVDLAVDLLDHGLCSAITVSSQLQWDTHHTNRLQHGHYQRLFEGLSRLADALVTREMIDDTLVVVASEFTRTPVLNSTGGKDHWPHASCLIFGANTRGNRVFGGSDDRLESLPVDLATGEVAPLAPHNKYDNLAAGLLAALDVDPDPWLPSVPPFTAFFE